jgi:hypothetical protein
MYDPESISCQSCRRALPKRNFPAAYVLPRYYQVCTACIRFDQTLAEVADLRREVAALKRELVAARSAHASTWSGSTSTHVVSA